ncbi:MAG: hypothetical protein AAGF11_29085 [Myxococcota bacterium]
MHIRTWMAAWLTVAAAGCQEAQYQAVKLRMIAGDVEAQVERGAVFVPRGGVLMVDVVPESTSDSPDYKGWEMLELDSTQPGVAQVRPAIVRDAWVVNGVQVGSARLDVTIDGQHVDSIDVDVEEVDR